MRVDPTLLESLQQSAQTALKVAETCLAIVVQAQREQQESQWMSLDEAAERLGPGISPDMLRERCQDGRFRHGVHFINTSDGKRGNYLVKVATVRVFFETDPARRPPLKRVV